jgi:hypothetical protein
MSANMGYGGSHMFTTHCELLGYEAEYLLVIDGKKYGQSTEKVAKANVAYYAEQGITATIETRQVPIVHCEDRF